MRTTTGCLFGFVFLFFLFWDYPILLAQEIGIRLDQPRVRLVLSPGETTVGSLRIENTSHRAITISTYTEDWLYDPKGNGNKKFLPAGATPYSCATWMRLSIDKIKILPAAQQEIRYFITAPSKVEGTYYAVVFFEGSPHERKPTEPPLGTTLAGRVASLFFIEIKDSVRREGVLEDLKFSKDQSQDPLEIAFTLRNVGNADIAAEGTLDILDSKGIVAGRGKLPNIYLHQGMAAPVRFSWRGNLSPGTYDGIFTYDLGDQTLLVKEQRIEVTPTGKIQ